MLETPVFYSKNFETDFLLYVCSCFVDFCLCEIYSVVKMDAKDDSEDVLMELEGREAVSTGIRTGLESSDKELALSLEDLAWVDSCLVPDSDVTESGNWDMMRDALLDVLNSHPDAPPPLLSNFSLEGEEGKGNVGKEENENGVDELRFENAFLPTYKEGMRETGDVGVEAGLGLGYKFFLNENETESSVDEIFKVWDLESLTEEGDFVTQLNKALIFVESIPPVSTDTSFESFPFSIDNMAMDRWKGTKDQSIDELIAAIGDLSLTQSNG